MIVPIGGLQDCHLSMNGPNGIANAYHQYQTNCMFTN